MAYRRRPELRPRTDDSGLSLAELLVAMMLSSVVFVVGGTMLNSTLRQRAFADAKTTSQADARIAVELLTRDLRVAVPEPGAGSKSAFSYASPRKITFYSQAGGSTPVISKITYEVDATSECLRRTTTPYTAGSFPSSATTTRCVAPGLVNTDGQALFAFYRILQDATTAPVEITVPSGGYAPPTQEDPLKFIASVRITLWLRAQDHVEVTPTVVDHSITLVNQSNAIRNGKIT
jgi:hypothetical protein